MEAVQHQILSSRPSGMTPRRAMIIGSVALLHVAAIWGLMNGMVGKALDAIKPPLVVVKIEKAVDPKTVPVPPKPVMQQPAQPRQVTVEPPIVDVVNNDPDVLRLPPTPVNPQPPVADSGAAGLSNTHTTPPYPSEARVMAHQGTVLLQMAVTAQGDVASASVVTSSGFAELDQAAIAWVVGHWKYKPAIRDGNAVPSQTQAAVRFDLKQARR